jgi:competence protein ComEC
MGARSAVALAVALWLGLACGASLPAAWAPVALLAGVLLVALTGPLPRLDALLVTAAGFAVLGLGRASAHRAQQLALERAIPPAGLTTRCVVRVVEPPRREGEAPSAVVEVLAADAALPRDTRVRLRLPPQAPAEWCDTLEVAALFERASPPRNPGGFDARAAARAADLHAHGRAFVCRTRPARSLASAPARALMRLRRGAEAALARALTPGARELVVPLLFGDRAGMSTDTDAALRASGLVHLLALSGLHVAWLAGVARGLAAIAGGGPLARALAGALSAAAYMAIAGPIPSLARAVVAEAVSALACATRRAVDPLQSLALAPLGLLALSPAWAYDLGFQLSCAATLGLVAIGGPWTSTIAPRGRFSRAVGAGVINAAAKNLLLTLAAQLAALPLLLARFHALPWTALGGNLAAVPLSEGLLAAAALGAALEGVLPGAGNVALAACEPLAAALHALTRVLGAWPGALLATGASPWPVAAAALGATALAIATPEPRALRARVHAATWRAPLRALGFAALGFACSCALTTVPLSPPPGRWWLVVLDVGQGDALAIADAHGWWLVDTGPRSPRWDAGEGAVLPYFRWAGVRRLDAVVLTHDDGDHTGGAAAVRRGLAVARWLGPVPRADVPGPCARFGARGCARGDTLPVPLRARVLWPPDARTAGVTLHGDNAASLVLEVGEGRARALLTADADSNVELALECAPVPAVLKAGHHGSGSSSAATFLARLRPLRVAVSCGARNPYGHPAPGTLARLAGVAAIVDRTDHDGALWYELGEAGVRRLDWRAGEPGTGARAGGGFVPAAGSPRAPRHF